MDKEEKILKPFIKLPANERAAALAHWIYVHTTRRDDNEWSLRVEESWADLDATPKQFNILTIDTWVDHPELLEAWIDAVKIHRKQRKRPPAKPKGSRKAARAPRRKS